MTIETLAKQFHLKATRDGYDRIILGDYGYLYIDAGEVCAVWVNAPVSPESLADLGTKVWVGDYTLGGSHYRGQRRRDAKVTGIPSEHYARAIRLVGAGKPKEQKVSK